jgi:hypothetical protein
VGQNNIIELNGKRYDAITGVLLGVATTKAHLPGAPASQRTRTVDGFLRAPGQRSHLAPARVKPSTPAVAKAPTAVKAAVVVPKKLVDRNTHAINPHQPEHPKTLMRRAVHKPDFKLKTAIKTQAPAELMAKPMSEIAKSLEKKLSVTHVNAVRLAHANHTPKSHTVRRFAATPKAMPASFAIPTPVVPAPPQRMAARQTPMRQTATIRPYAHTAPVRSTATTQHVVAPAQAQTAVISKDPNDIFERAIAHAMSHEQKPPVVRRRNGRLLNVVAGLASFVVIGGFIAYLNVNAINLRVASMHAGFSAHIPGYHLTGYSLGPIQAQHGSVALSFRSGDSSYQLTQQTSTWNSQTLLDSSVALQGTSHETVQSKGRTIYLYGSNASWVNGGVRYDISSNGVALSKDDIVSIATSM